MIFKRSANQAIIEGIHYLKNRLNWSGIKIAKILHLAPNTFNTWLKNGTVPIHSTMISHLSPRKFFSQLIK